MTGGCGTSGEDEAQWMDELLEELGGGSSAGGRVEGAAGELQAGCTGSSCSKKRMRHINNERQRRILMNNLLDSLQSLLPDPHPRKDRCALLTDVIAHVQSLEEEIQDLAARTAHMKSRAKSKLPRNSSNSGTPPDTLVTTSLRQVHVQLLKPYNGREEEEEAIMAGVPSMDQNPAEQVIITFASLPSKGLLPHVLALFHKNHIEVINTTLSTTPADAQMLYYIHASVPKKNCVQGDYLKSLLSNARFQEDDVTYSFTI